MTKSTTSALWVGAIVLFISSSRRAAGEDPTVLGKWPGHPRGAPQSIVVDGDNAFVTAYNSITSKGALISFSLSAPATPKVIGGCETPGQAFHVAITNGIAYVADGRAGLQVINVSRPQNPYLVTNTLTPGSAMYVVLEEHYAYIAAGSAGLQILDIANPAAPKRIGSFSNPGDTTQIAVKDKTAYLASASGGLVILDIANKSNPQKLFARQGGYEPSVVCISSNTLILGQRYTIDFYNVENPKVPVLVSSVTRPNQITRVTSALVSNDRLIVGLSESKQYGGAAIYDIKDKAYIRPIGQIATAFGDVQSLAYRAGVYYFASEEQGIGTLAADKLNHLSEPYEYEVDASDLLLANGYAFVAVSNGVDILTIHDYKVPTLVQHYPTTQLAKPRLLEKDSCLYIIDGGELEIVGISNPETPTKVGRLTLPEPMERGCELLGDCIAVKGRLGVTLLDVGNARSPRVVGTHTANSLRFDPHLAAFASTNRAYVPAEGSVLCLDLTNLIQPKILWRFGSDYDSNHRPFLYSHYLYMNSDRGVDIIDLSQDLRPAIAGIFKTTWPITADSKVIGDYVLGWVSQFVPAEIFDFRDPSAPRKIGAFEPKDLGVHAFVTGIAGSSNILALRVYTQNPSWAGLQFYDATTLAAASATNSYDTGGSSYRLALDGSLLYITERRAGLRVLDVTDRASMSEAAHLRFRRGDDARLITKRGHLIAVALQDRVALLDASAPLRIAPVGFHPTPVAVDDLALLSDLLLTAWRERDAFGKVVDSVLEVVDISDPRRPTSAGMYRFGDAVLALSASPAGVFLVGGRFDGAPGTPATIAQLNTTDVGNPSVVLGAQLAGKYGLGVVGTSNSCVVTTDTSELFVLAAANIAAPPTGRIRTKAPASRIAENRNWVWLAEGPYGVELVNVDSSGAPKIVGGFNSDGTAADVVADEISALVSEGERGVLALGNPPPASPSVSIVLGAGQSVTIRWSSGSRLETSPSASGPWTSVNSDGQSLAVVSSGRTRFYRAVR